MYLRASVIKARMLEGCHALPSGQRVRGGARGLAAAARPRCAGGRETVRPPRAALLADTRKADARGLVGVGWGGRRRRVETGRVAASRRVKKQPTEKAGPRSRGTHNLFNH